MGRYYDKLHFYLKRKLDRLSPRAHRRLLIALFSVYGLLSCYFTAQLIMERKNDPSLEKIIDSPIRTDSIIIIKPIKKSDNHHGKG